MKMSKSFKKYKNHIINGYVHVGKYHDFLKLLFWHIKQGSNLCSHMVTKRKGGCSSMYSPSFLIFVTKNVPTLGPGHKI